MKADICAVADIPRQGSLKVELFGRPLHVVMTGEGRPLAYADVCLHFGGPLECREDGVFECAWHQATFERDTGARIDGPAPSQSRLMRLSTVSEDGMLKYVASWQRSARGEASGLRRADDEADSSAEAVQALVVRRVDEVVLLEDRIGIGGELVRGERDTGRPHGREDPAVVVLAAVGVLQRLARQEEHVARVLALRNRQESPQAGPDEPDQPGGLGDRFAGLGIDGDRLLLRGEPDHFASEPDERSHGEFLRETFRDEGLVQVAIVERRAVLSRRKERVEDRVVARV